MALIVLFLIGRLWDFYCAFVVTGGILLATVLFSVTAAHTSSGATHIIRLWLLCERTKELRYLRENELAFFSSLFLVV